jgi:hypothetical protein
MIGFLVFLLVVAALGAATWFYGPQLNDWAKLKQQNARVVRITKQTKRDMDDLARRQRRGEW